MTERLTLVDENDQLIRVGDRKEAWANGYYTRNIRVVLRDQNGRFLSQKRSMKKDTFAGMWTVAASGHVDEGETWVEAALRETREEIGISASLKLVGDFIFKNDEGDKKIRQIIHVYEGIIDGSTQFDLEEDEVEDIKWYELDELKSLMQEIPDKFTPSFRETISRFYS
ncbi:MAG TPA: NUDIX domain-containing protein [Candidatus Saccharimonadales bacterium]|nr:NUDIX domain-containing protein [Candidatus Saccharimonadales bacterium]